MDRLTLRNSDGTYSQPTSLTFEKLFYKLAEYEDLEEQGRLIKLPCKVGDTVYVNSWGGKAEPHKVRKITMPFVYANLVTDKGVSKEGTMDFYIDEFEKSVFLSKAEAEKALEDMKNA